MTEAEAIEHLSRAKLAAIKQGSPADIKRLRDSLLANDVAALVDCPSPSGGG